MAQISVRANLSAVQIPLLTEEFGRSVIVRQQDMNYNPTLAAQADIDKDAGIPQVFYAHNVMPTNYGYRSVAVSQQIPAGPATDFDQVFNLLASTGEKAFLAITTTGALYVCHLGVGYVWTLLSNTFKATITEGTNTGSGYVVSASVANGTGAHTYVATMTSATAFSLTRDGVAQTAGTVGTEYSAESGKVKFTINAGDIAFVSGDTFTITTAAATFTGAISLVAISGETYLCSEGVGIFQYDYATNTLTWRHAAGLDPTGLLGITASNGYMIAYSEDAVAWSSVIDPLDFIPSLSTGAGAGSVEEAKGPIRRCVGLTSGFLVFTTSNCVAAVFSQNIRYPFTFREVPNAGGISDLTLVTDEADSTAVYAFTSHGLQQISTQKAQAIMAELSDFLTGRRFEDFDSATLSFTISNTLTPLKKRVEFVSGRFLVVSYGISTFTHALVYDTALQRFGKIKLTHRSVFQYGFLDADDADTPKKQLAFMNASGAIYTLDFSAGVTAADSVLLLGKYQYVRQRMLQLCSVEVESVDPSETLVCYDLKTLDGKTFLTPVAGHLANPGSYTRRYNFRETGLNHTVLLKGTFRLNSVVINLAVSGSAVR